MVEVLLSQDGFRPHVRFKVGVDLPFDLQIFHDRFDNEVTNRQFGRRYRSVEKRRELDDPLYILFASCPR